MTAAPLDTVLRHIRRITAAPQEPTDGQLLARFTTRRDELAFAELVRRHGPMVLGVCRRLLRNPPDRDDAFQAAFLVLVRRAATLLGSDCLGPWLYGVARRTALKARAAALRRSARQTEVSDMPAPEAADALEVGEIHRLLDEELDRLPEKYRAPLVLCYLQGQTHEQAARQLGRPAGSMSRQVGRALELLRGRLARRGAGLTAGVLSAMMAQEMAAGAVPAALANGTVCAASLLAAGNAAASRAVALAGAVVLDLARARVKRVTALLLAVALLAGGAGLAALPAPPPQEPPAPVGKPEADTPDRADGDPLPAGALMRFGSTRLRHGQAVSGLAFSKDGKTLFSSSYDRTISLWDLSSGKEVRRFEESFLPVPDFLRCIALSPDGKIIASGGRDFCLRDAATGKELYRKFSHNGPVYGVAFSPDGKLAAYTMHNAADTATVAHVVEAATGKEVVPLTGHSAMALAVAFSPDGKTIATANDAPNDDAAVCLWETATGKETARLKVHASAVSRVAFSPDGKTLASGGFDGTLRFRDLATNKETKKIRADPGTGSGNIAGVSGVSFSPDGKLVAACTFGGRAVRVFDVATGKELRAFTGGGFCCVAFSPDGRTLAAGDDNNAIRLWEMPGGKVIQPAEPHDAGVHCVAVSPDGKTLAASTTFKTVYLWDVTTGKLLRRLDGHEQGVYPVAFSPDGKRVASGSRDGTARVWDVATGKELHKFRGYDGPKSGEVWVYGVSFSPDGKRLAGACRDGLVRVWELATGEEVVRCEKHDGFVCGVAFAPDGKTLASCGDGSLMIWDASTGKLVRGVVGTRYEALAYSPDGRLVVVGSNDGGVRLIDAASGRTIHELKEHPNGFFRKRLAHRDGRTVAFAPDGRMVAWGSWQVAQVWEVATGQERLSFSAHRGEVMSVAFLPDGRRLATGSTDTTAVVWDLSACALGERGPAKVTPADVERLWTDLHGEDGHKSYRALWTLAAAPKEVMPLLRSHLKPAAPTDRDRLERLVKNLDADAFEDREKATEELAKLGAAAEAVLRKALEGTPSAEVKQRVELLLGKLRTASASPEHTRESRELQLLEQLGTPEATALLKELAEGAADAWLTKEAKAALKRRP